MIEVLKKKTNLQEVGLIEKQIGQFIAAKDKTINQNKIVVTANMTLDTEQQGTTIDASERRNNIINACDYTIRAAECESIFSLFTVITF